MKVFTTATNKHVKEMFTWQFDLWTAKKNYSLFIWVVPELAKQLVLSTEPFTFEVHRSRNSASWVMNIGSLNFFSIVTSLLGATCRIFRKVHAAWPDIVPSYQLSWIELTVPVIINICTAHSRSTWVVSPQSDITWELVIKILLLLLIQKIFDFLDVFQIIHYSEVLRKK